MPAPHLNPNDAAALCIQLLGPLKVTLANGTDVTPKSAKSRGVLALLATAPDNTRSRLWLQEKLWSERRPAQSNASLRQALSDIRRSLGTSAGALVTDGPLIRLEGAKVLDADKSTSADCQFLEGLDIRDPAFNLWLATQRTHRRKDARGAHPGQFEASPMRAMPDAPVLARQAEWRPLVHLIVMDNGDPEAVWIGNAIADQTSALLRHVHGAEVCIHRGKRTGPPSRGGRTEFDAEIDTIVGANGLIGLRLNLSDSQSRSQIWQTSRRLTSDGLQVLDDPVTSQTISLLVDATANAIYARHAHAADTKVPQVEAALRKMFSMRPEDVQEADLVLATTQTAAPVASVLAWRAQVRTIQFAERHSLDREALAQSAQEFAAKALEMDPFNAIALSAAANVKLHLDRDIETGRQFAEAAVRHQPGNSFALWSASAGALYGGDIKRADTTSDVALSIARFSRNRFWWDLQKAAVALVAGRPQEARQAFEAAAEQRPEFRPPLRYLVALYAAEGQMEKAAAYARKLQALEPDFSVERLLQDHEYPASLLFKAHGLTLDPLWELV